MQKIILAIFVIISMSSCDTYKRVPLSMANKHDPIAIVKTPGLSKDQAWDRAVRLFADRNIYIKAIDKSSGFIQSDLLSFVQAYQIDSAPAPPHPVYVLTQRERAYHTVIQPSYITGYLKVFILNDSAQTEVRVSIEDLRNFHLVNVHHSHSSAVTRDEISISIVSTGVLESQVANYITTGQDLPYTWLVPNGEIQNPNDNYSQYLKKKSNRAMAAYAVFAGGIGLTPLWIALATKH